METSGGGWTIIQRRKSGLVSFYQDWRQYKQGFGSIRGDFWLGNEHIHRLTRQPTRLRVELEVSSSRQAPTGPGPSHAWFRGTTTVLTWCVLGQRSKAPDMSSFLSLSEAELQMSEVQEDPGQNRLTP